MLVGREPECRAVGELLAAARLGQGRALVLSGDPGMGKTALLHEAVGLAGEMRVLRAAGVEAERLLPFAGLSQVVWPLLPLLDGLPAPQAAALRSALLLAEDAEGPAPTRFATGAATLSLLSRAAEECPLVVLVDDAHLLDEASSGALAFAARRLGSDPVAVLATVRAGEDAGSWADLPRLDLVGLDLEAAAALVGGADQEHPDRLQRLHRATGGNPLAMLELGDAVPRGGPEDSPVPLSDRIVRSFLRRTESLSGAGRDTLLVAATDGSSVSRVLEACRLLGIPGPGLGEAEDAGLVAVREDRVEFRHPLVRAAVYGAAGPERRRAVHRALAAVIPAAEPGRLAWHLSESAVPPDDGTADTLQEVARSATRRGAHAVAATALERAAELAGARERRAELLVDAAGARWLGGQPQQALALADRAGAAHPGPRVRARVEELRGGVLTRSGSLVAAQATLLRAAEEVGEEDPALAVSLHADAVHVAFFVADPRAAMRSRDALERLLAQVTDPAAVALAGMASGMALVLAGQGAAGVGRVREALGAMVDGRLDEAALLRHPLLAQGALWVRDTGAMRHQLARAVDRLRDRAALGSLPVLLMQIGRSAATADHWDDAATAYAEAIRLARETGQSTDLAMALAGLSVLEARRGHRAQCHELADEAQLIATRDSVRIAEVWACFARGDLAAGAGDPMLATRHYEQVEAVLGRTGLVDPDQSAAPELVEARLHLGRSADAAALASEHQQRAAAKGEPWALARAARAVGLCAEDPEAAEECFRTALALHAETPDVFETARTQAALGARLRRDRRRVEARRPLREALATFEDLGARPWADRAAQELEATGETARRRELGPVETLTPQERQIAQLLASGRTTREAAGALFLSPKTVEYHLRHVYQKLGINSRAELAEVMPEHP